MKADQDEGVGETRVFSDWVQSEDQISDAISASAELSGTLVTDYGVFSGSLAASFARQVHTNSRMVSCLAIGQRTTSTMVVNWAADNVIAAETIAEIKQFGYDAFVEKNGTHVVCGKQSGSELHCSYSASYATESLAEQARVTLRAKYNNGLDQVALSADLATDMAATHATSGGVWRYEAIGWTPTSTIEQTAQGIATAIGEFQVSQGSGQDGVPMYWLCCDWRMFKQIQEIAPDQTGASDAQIRINFPLVMQWVRDNTALLQLAEKAEVQKPAPIGATAINAIPNSKRIAQKNLDAIAGLSPKSLGQTDLNTYDATDQLSLINDVRSGTVFAEILYPNPKNQPVSLKFYPGRAFDSSGDENWINDGTDGSAPNGVVFSVYMADEYNFFLQVAGSAPSPGWWFKKSFSVTPGTSVFDMEILPQPGENDPNGYWIVKQVLKVSLI